MSAIGNNGLRSALRRIIFAWVTALTACALLPSSASAAVFEPREFSSPQIEARYQQLTAELRCLVCQNANIAESNAPLAQDLRREVFRMLNEGLSDAQIVDFMVQRYGDFVLFRPPVKGMTVALWAGPFVLMLLGLLFLWRLLIRRRAAAAATAQVPLSADDRERLRKLVAE